MKKGYLIFGAWRSLVAHLFWEQGVGGSNPLAPTNLVIETERQATMINSPFFLPLKN